MAIGSALSLGMLLALTLVVGLGSPRSPSALAASETLLAAGNAHALAATGSITGLVQTASSGTPVVGAVVEIYDGVSFALLYTTTTNASGQYSATVTAPYGQVRLFFDGRLAGYSQEWYRGKSFFSQADRVSLEGGGIVTSVNTLLSEHGILSGTITLDGGAPAIDVCVSVLDTNEGCNAHTDHQGQFIVTDLMSGTHRLVFSGGAFPGVLVEWYQNKYSSDAATPVLVTAGTATVIAAQVTSRNVITGLVTDASSGLAIDNAGVKLYDEAGTITRELSLPCFLCGPGEYQFYSLGPGRYRLRFEHPPYHATEFYSNQQTLATATFVSVTAGQVVTGINAALTTGPTGTLVLTLTQNGLPLSTTHWVELNLHDTITEFPKLTTLRYIQGEGETTMYTFTVQEGVYKIYFGATSPLHSEWYSSQDVFATADVFTVTADATTIISADLAVTPPSSPIYGCITGTVTSGGFPLQGAVVWAYPVASDQPALSDKRWTDADGIYGPVCVQPGDYQVGFSYFPSMTTWYSGTFARTIATAVTVTTNITAANINGSLGELGGCISGRIVGSDNQGVASADFRIRDAGGSLTPFWYGLNGSLLRDEGYADLDGGFVACGLATGFYTMQCPGVGGNTSVDVTAPQETSGVTCLVRRIYLPIIVRHS